MDIKLTEKCFMGMYGAYAAMFTPYDKKGRVDDETIARIIDYGLKGGLKGFYLTGTTGEWWLLSVAERKQLMGAAVKAMRGRGKLIAHVGANNTDDSVELAKHAANIGIDWVSSVAPQLYRTSFDATMYHYRRISSATDLPFMIYSFGAALVPEWSFLPYTYQYSPLAPYAAVVCARYRISSTFGMRGDLGDARLPGTHVQACSPFQNGTLRAAAFCWMIPRFRK